MSLTEAYDRLLSAFGPQHWWPGETPFEIVVGAVLTQNTAWKNVELAIENQIDRYSLAIDAIDCVPGLQQSGAHAKERFRDQQMACLRHAFEHGIDPPEIRDWVWPF